MNNLKSLLALALTGGLALTISCQTAASQQQQVNNQKNAVNLSNTQIAQSTPEEAKRISLEEAKAVYDKGNVVIVDTRDAGSFKTEHIKGAVNIPLPEFEKRYQEIPAGKQIIAYCS